ncbi:MAG: ATPase domain-containing protein, partial [Dolichospermum sp.]
MAKAKTIYICSNCAAEFSQWFGKCSNCDTYDSLVEQNISSFIGDIPSRGGVGNWHNTQGNVRSNTKPAKARSALTFDQISDRQIARWESGYGELDRVLGGGIVPGSMVLIGGDPGIGKSTLLLQVSNQLALKYRILYVTGEESGQQVKLRASRLGMSKAPTVVTEDDSEVFKNTEKNLDPDR